MEITKFLDRKKRDLSSKSNDRDDSKRLRESSLDDSITNTANTDVFTESLKSEDYVAILYSCRKKLEVKMRKVLKMYEKNRRQSN